MVTAPSRRQAAHFSSERQNGRAKAMNTRALLRRDVGLDTLWSRTLCALEDNPGVRGRDGRRRLAPWSAKCWVVYNPRRIVFMV